MEFETVLSILIPMRTAGMLMSLCSRPGSVLLVLVTMLIDGDE